MVITIGSIIAVATAITKMLVAAGLAFQGLKAVCGALTSLGKALGLINPNEQVEELGEKALQAKEAGITPDGFPTFEAYHKKISEFPIDKEKAKLHTDEQRLSEGAGVIGGLVAEKYPELNVSDVVANMVKNNGDGFFSDKNMKNGLADLIKAGGKTINDILGVLNGTEKNQETIAKTIGKMVSIEKASNPGMSDDAATNKVLNYR